MKKYFFINYFDRMNNTSEKINLYSNINCVTPHKINKEMNLLQAELNSLNKQLGRSLKNKLKDRSDQREPSGFAKPAKIKSQLANFLGLESGTLLARTEVTKHITAYIKKHSLNFPEDKRIILPDAKLKALLKVGKGEQLTYFNLQHYLAPHFEQQ